MQRLPLVKAWMSPLARGRVVSVNDMVTALASAAWLLEE